MRKETKEKTKYIKKKKTKMRWETNKKWYLNFKKRKTNNYQVFHISMGKKQTTLSNFGFILVGLSIS